MAEKYRKEEKKKLKLSEWERIYNQNESDPLLTKSEYEALRAKDKASQTYKRWLNNLATQGKRAYSEVEKRVLTAAERSRQAQGGLTIKSGSADAAARGADLYVRPSGEKITSTMAVGGSRSKKARSAAKKKKIRMKQKKGDTGEVQPFDLAAPLQLDALGR